MALNELQVLLPGEHLELWSDAMMEAGAISVSIQDDDLDSPDEVPVYGEPGLPAPPPGWTNNRVSILLDAATAADQWLAELAGSLELPLPFVVSCQALADQDWVRQTQEQFTPVYIGRIAVVPSWHEAPSGPDWRVLRIDPGVAFGTGTHPTTGLCLAWLDQHIAPSSSVLDYGCGSGILSICAAKLGATPVIGVDIDPQAVQTAARNAQSNQVASSYLTGDEFAATHPDRRFDVVVANILANPLVVLAPALVNRLKPGSWLLLSGILERQVPMVIDAYRALAPGLELRPCGAQEGWVALSGQLRH
jgi:ribosomal protein L11 methyltransferase